MAIHTDAQSINGNYKGKDIISIDQFTTSDFLILFKQTKKLKENKSNKKTSSILKGKLITLIFYEPSSRTFGSFSAAAKRLGGQTLDILNPEKFSSVVKGESLEDTIRVFETYSDALVIRHSKVGTANLAAKVAKIPILNAGDGIGEHPTQALLDLFTIYEKTKKLHNLTGVLAGDMLYGRTAHSLIQGLSKYKSNKLYLLSPISLRLKRNDLARFKNQGIEINEIENYKDIPRDADFWYWTRIQKERFKNKSQYEKVKNKFVLSNKLIKEKANKNTIFLHPLPRVGELLTEVDSNPSALYLNSQIRNGMYVRMALLSLVLGNK